VPAIETCASAIFTARTRHEGCGGRTLEAELVAGAEGVSSDSVRRIVLRAR
jgi:hypothetical protein